MAANNCAYSSTLFIIILSFALTCIALFMDNWAYDEKNDITYGLLALYNNKGTFYDNMQFYSSACTAYDDLCLNREKNGVLSLTFTSFSLFLLLILLYLVRQVQVHKMRYIKWYISFFSLLSVSICQLIAYIIWTISLNKDILTIGSSCTLLMINFISICTMLGFSSKSQLMAPI